MRWLASIRENEDVTVVDITKASIFLGEAYGDLRETVKELLDAGKMSILINLANVRCVDSSGINDLIVCHNCAKRRSSQLKLLRPQREFNDLLAKTKLNTVMEIFSEEIEAVRSFRKRPAGTAA